MTMLMKRLIRRLTAPAALAAAVLLAAWGPLAVPVLAASQPNITPSTVQIVPPGTTYPDVAGTLLDQYGNPIPDASLTLTMENATSGATPATLGPFTGTTNSNGQFSIQVTPGAVGQFWPEITATNQYGSATFQYPNDLLNVTQYPPSALYEWAVYGSNGPQNTSNVTPSTFTGQLYPVAAQLVNDTGTPINGVNVTVSVPTDPGATVMALPPSCLETSSGCSSTESGTGSLQQTTGTYAANSGEVGVDVIFTQPGQQTVEVQYNNTVQTLTVTVYPGAVAQITNWAVDAAVVLTPALNSNLTINSSAGFSESGSYRNDSGNGYTWVNVAPGGAGSVTYTFTASDQETVVYGIPAGGFLNNDPVDIAVDGTNVATITTDIGGGGSTTSTWLQLWQYTFSPGSHTITFTSGSGYTTIGINVYGLWLGNYANNGGTPVGSSVQAGTVLYVSGTAVNSDGQQVPAGTQVVVEMPGSNAAPVTTYTVQTASGTGYFQAQLTPTAAGSWWVEAQASGSTFQDVDLGVTPAGLSSWPTYMGIEQANNGTTWAPQPTGYQPTGQYKMATACLPGTGPGFGTTCQPLAEGLTSGIWVGDKYGNGEDNQTLPISFVCSASNGGSCPASPASPITLNAGGVFGWSGWSTPGSYVVYAEMGGQIISGLQFSISASAEEPNGLANASVTICGPPGSGYQPDCTTTAISDPASPPTLTAPAGSSISMSGCSTYNGAPDLGGWEIFGGIGGTGNPEKAISSNPSTGCFVITGIMPYEAGTGTSAYQNPTPPLGQSPNDAYDIWATPSFGWGWLQPLDVLPGPVAQMSTDIVGNGAGVQWWATTGAAVLVDVSATDQYGNPVSGMVDWSTTMPTSNGTGGPGATSGSFSLNNGQGSFGLWSVSHGTWPITLTVKDQYDHLLTQTIYVSVG